jgi:hypothetical protein
LKAPHFNWKAEVLCAFFRRHVAACCRRFASAGSFNSESPRDTELNVNPQPKTNF